MKKATWMIVMVLVGFFSTPAAAAEVEDYSRTISVFEASPAVKKFFENSYGFAVFPTIGKGGWVIGGSFGRGQVYRGGQVTGKVTVVEGSIGFQLGGKAFSEIIFFQDKRAYEEFISGSFEFGATAQAIVITAGLEAKAGTTGATAAATAGPRTGVQAEIDYVNGMAVFVHSKGGLMYEASIGGQKFNFEPL
jgi:lipid-binding SYLF domain-containing protein